MENNYQNPPAPMNTPPVMPSVESPGNNMPPQNQASEQMNQPPQPKSPIGRVLLAIVAILVFFGIGFAGVLVSQKQYTSQAPVAPNVPESKPEAAIVQSNCTLTFNVPTPTPTPEPNECGYTPCSDNNDCKDDLVCITADSGDKYCSVEEYKIACAQNPSATTCCNAPTPTPTPTPTPELISCGETPCDDNFDCAGNLICIQANDGKKYCADSAYRATCEASPTYSNCCQAPTPTPTTLIATSSAQPELPPALPESGPADWLKWLQTGLAALGAGALLLLLL